MSTDPGGDERAKVEWDLFEAIDREIGDVEEVQANKVIELARRILPGLTAEDIRNPHDFPDLDDPDWQYEDGVLAGIQGVRVAMRAMRNRRAPEPTVRAADVPGEAGEAGEPREAREG